MRILILTQNESLYLPLSISRVLRDLANEVVCVVTAPAMSTHGGAIQGFLKHVNLFGIRDSLRMITKVIRNRLIDRMGFSGPEGLVYSIRSAAAAFNIPYHRVVKVNSMEFQALIDRYKPDLLISMSCPQIIGKKVRERFAMGCINVHGAPLPRYRGLMPAFWALRNRERVTAVTVHDIADKLDNGDILLQREVPISENDTWDSLVRKTKLIGAEALVQVVRQIAAGSITRRRNPDDEATYFSFPTAKDRKAFRASGRRFF